MKQAYISLGSNLGSPVLNVNRALKELEDLKGITSFRQSRLYETEPISKIPQNSFINAVCAFMTFMTPEELLMELQRIEKALGKLPKGKDEPRIIDLDLLFLGQEVRYTHDLALPHPEWHKRLFVLQPLLDLDEVIFLSAPINIRNLIVSLTPSNKVRVL